MTTESFQAREQAVYSHQALKEDRPRDDYQLWLWVSRILGFSIAYRPVCPEHDAPFTFLADAFFERFTAAALQGPRGGGKTRNMALLHVLNGHFKPGYQSAHVGSILRQANLCYNYVKDSLRDPFFLHRLLQEPMMTQTQWLGGGRLQILPGTIGGVSGPHPNLAVADEFDLLDWEVYQQFIGMPQSTRGYNAQAVYTSTMYSSFGPLARLIDESEGRGLKVYRSCIWDVMAPCDGDKPWGTGPVCYDGIAQERGQAIASPPACPLWEDCGGKVREGTGHILRADVIARRQQADQETWDMQYLGKRVSVKGLVYDTFNPEPGPLGTTNVSYEADYREDLPVYWCGDDGYHPDPLVLLATHILPNGDIWVFNEIQATRTLYGSLLSWVHDTVTDETGRTEEVWPWQEVEWNGDTAHPTGEVWMYKKPAGAHIGLPDRQLQFEIGRLGIPVRVPTKTTLVMDGIRLLRTRIKDANGHRGLIIHPRCKWTIQQFTQYHKKRLPNGEFLETPADNNGRSNPDDGPDSLRYMESYLFDGRQNRIRPAW